MLKRLTQFLGLSLVVLATTAALGAAPKVDPAVKAYAPVSGISGNLSSIGSDTLNNLMTFWAEGFRKQYPTVNIQVEGKGSATAPPALTEGTAQLGPMSRGMKPEEEEAFEKKHGCKPTRISVALDCLAVFVHKDNTVKGLTMEQLDCIFSKTRKSGYGDLKTWDQVWDLPAEFKSLPISLYGRNSASGTYAYFKEHALLKGDYKDTVKEQPGSAAVVNGVANDRAGIGYSGIGYVTSEVRALPIAKKGGEKPVEPTFENALNGKYPLARMLFIYVAKKPNEKLSPTVGEFLKFVLSAEGQEIVLKDGYGPLPASVIEKQLKALESR
jgi:phosphate transport system substrate-binding protein